MAKKKPMVYETLTGLQKINMSKLDAHELAFLREIVEFLKTKPDWNEFTNQLNLLRHKYQIQRDSPAIDIGNDIDARNGIAKGMVAEPNYQDQMNDLIKEKFKNRVNFCKKTGIDGSTLGSILTGNGSVRELEIAAEKLGYRVILEPQKSDSVVRKRISLQRSIEMLRGL